MRHLKENIKYLRTKKNLTQEGLSEKLGVKRATIGTYEDGRAEPKLATLQKLCEYFKVNYEELLNKDLSKQSSLKSVLPNSGQKFKVLSIAVDSDDNEFITYVPFKARAGYLNSYGDVEFLGSLPTFKMPFPELSTFKTYRAFEIQGNSMLPMKSGSYIIAEYIPESSNIRDGDCYVLLTKEDGIVYKRIRLPKNDSDTLLLISDNKEYQPYEVQLKDVFEIWKAQGYVSFEIPNENDYPQNLHDLSKIVLELQQRIDSIQNNE